MKTTIRFIPGRREKLPRVCGVVGLGVSLLLSACASRSEFQKGYDHGSADTAKRQYWILQNMQKGGAEKNSAHLTYYRFTVPPDPNATVKTVPQQIAIPVYE